MSTSVFQTPEQIQIELGERLRQLRLSKNQDQVSVAEKAGISARALRGLESGTGSSLVTLIRVLKALDALSSLDAIAAMPTISPVTLFKRGRAPRRASKPRRTTR